MSIFNSLGTNYTGKMVWRSLLPAKKTATQDLAQKLTTHYGAQATLLTFKCREALAFILRELNLPTGSKVAINGFTCYVVYEAVEAAGLVPHFLDISPGELNFSAETVEQALKADSSIKVVMIQNSLGIPSDAAAIKKVCDKAGIHLVEDLAHSAGLKYTDGQEAGTVGVAAALSFGQNKIIDAAAGGAAVFHKDITPPDALPSVSLWLKLTTYWYPLNTWFIRKTHRFIIGKVLLKVYKSLKIIPEPADGYAGDVRVLPTHEAGLALAYFNDLDTVIAHRQKIAEIYRSALPASVQLKHFDEAIYIRFPLIVKDRMALTRYLQQFQVLLGTPWYDVVVAPRRFMSKVAYEPGSCPEGEKVAEQIINLPTHININEATAHFIADKVNAWLQLQN